MIHARHFSAGKLRWALRCQSGGKYTSAPIVPGHHRYELGCPFDIALIRSQIPCQEA